MLSSFEAQSPPIIYKAPPRIAKAMSKLSDMLIDSHLGQRCYHSWKNIFNQLHIVSQSWSGGLSEKHKFNHSTLTLYTFRGFRGRIMHLIESIYLVSRCANFDPHSAALQLCFSSAANKNSKLILNLGCKRAQNSNFPTNQHYTHLGSAWNLH